MNILSLCSGIAGLDLGVKIALPDARTVGYVERDGYCQRVLLARMSDGSLDAAPLWGDLCSFAGRPWRGAVDMVIAGFPCQPWSLAGRRQGREDARWLWPKIVRVVREVGPRYVFLENVPGLLVHAGMGSVLGDLADLGFNAEWLCLSAAAVGAPHLRKRVFILGVADAASQRLQGTEPNGQRHDIGALAGNHQRSLAHSGSERLEGNGEAGPASGPVGRGSGAVMGDSARHLWRAPGNGERDASDGTGDLPLFPPGPAHRAGWAAVLARAPHLEPAVRKLDARFPARVDQLKALGNSVVVLQAAAAFTVLARRLGEWEESTIP